MSQTEFITQTQMNAGVDNPMSDPAANPAGGGPGYADRIRHHLASRPMRLSAVLIAIAGMRANCVRPDDGALYDIDVDAEQWCDIQCEPAYAVMGATPVQSVVQNEYAAVFEMPHAGARFRVLYGSTK